MQSSLRAMRVIRTSKKMSSILTSSSRINGNVRNLTKINSRTTTTTKTITKMTNKFNEKSESQFDNKQFVMNQFVRNFSTSSSFNANSEFQAVGQSVSI